MKATVHGGSESGSPASVARPSHRTRHLVGSAVAAVLWVSLSLAHLTVFNETGRPVGLPYLLQVSFVTALFLLRRGALRVSSRPLDWMAAMAATFGPLLLRPTGAHAPWGDVVGLPLQLIGLVVSVVALGTLGKCFGLVAADRGLVTSGPYGVVRHPAYTAYIVAEIGYLMQSFTWLNLGIVAAVWIAQFRRVQAEERMLSGRPDYRVYRERVRWRLVPGLV
jgi:protein-S-isoprenylcysteine O-methyltransferase Ste14